MQLEKFLDNLPRFVRHCEENSGAVIKTNTKIDKFKNTILEAEF